MKSYDITGMSCAGCASRIEKAISALDGVTGYNVSLLTNTLTLDGNVSDEQVISAVVSAGYGASVQGSKNEHSPDKNGKKPQSQARALMKRFLLSLSFLIALMYFSMGFTMWGFPLPGFLVDSPIYIALIQMALSIVIMVINRQFYINGYKAIIKRTGNMGVLVSLGSLSAFIYSFVKMMSMLGKTQAEQMHVLHQMYFESAAMVLALITFGKALEAYSKGKTTNAVKALMDLSPKTAVLLVDGKETTVSALDVKVGDIFIVRAGAQIPADGEVIEGECSVDESALTGESMPVKKTQGSAIYAATVNKSGYIKCRATKESSETVLAQIIKTVKEASGTKAPVQKVADKASAIFVPAVILIAVVTVIMHLLIADATFGQALERGVSVLLISCPCALGLATPVAIMVGSGVGARMGILFKNATALEEAGKVSIVALDKTGTITRGVPSVTDIIPYGISSAELMALVYSAEQKSEHPLSLAINEKAQQMGVLAGDVYEFDTLSGLGIRARLENGELFVGNERLICQKCEPQDDALEVARTLSAQGKTPIFACLNGELIGIVAIADEIKPSSIEAISDLKQMGLRVVMLTGDNEITARSVAGRVGIDEVISCVMPTEKGEAIKSLSTQGEVAMVGDGINDAPALTSAHVGIAIGSGTDVAMDSADVVLARSELSDAVSAIRLSKKTLANIKQNLFWAFFYNMACIPLAAGLYGLAMKPMYGALAMSMSSIFVVMNALRLNLFKEKAHMESKIVFKVQGIMCGHCEKAIKDALSVLPCVKESFPSHESGRVEVVLNTENAPLAEIEQAIVGAGFKVLGTEK